MPSRACQGRDLPATAKADIVSKSARILVVEDEVVQRMLVRHRLELAGYQVEEATDGQMGLDLVPVFRPDLVLLDCMLPGLDGFQVLKRLRRDPEHGHIPILMITALSNPAARRRGLEMGADDFLLKPVEETQLLARVRSLVRISAMNRDLRTRDSLLRQVLTRYLSAAHVAEILENPGGDIPLLGGSVRRISVLQAEIRGFGGYQGSHRPEVVTSTLNSVFDALVPRVFENGGTFDKYLGNSVLAFYGAPTSYTDDALRAVRTGMQMHDSFADLQAGHPDLADLALSVAVASGDALVGNLGSRQVLDYTIMGDAVELCRQVQELAGPGQVLICPATHRQVERHVEARALEPVQLEGRPGPMQLHEILGFLP